MLSTTVSVLFLLFTHGCNQLFFIHRQTSTRRYLCPVTSLSLAQQRSFCRTHSLSCCLRQQSVCSLCAVSVCLSTSGMLSIVDKRERTHLGSMHVHAQLLVVLVSVYSYSPAFTPSYSMYGTAKFVRPRERGRINCSLISVTISVTLKSSRSLHLSSQAAAG